MDDIQRAKATDFIIKSKLMHGEATYGYDHVIYKNVDTKVELQCNVHGSFMQTPYNHQRGQGCKICKRIPSEASIRSNGANFIANCKLKHAICDFDYSHVVYVNAKTLVTIACKLHGLFSATPDSILSAKFACNSCAHMKAGLSRRKSTQRFIAKAIERHGTRYDYTDTVYISSNEKVTIRCADHGLFDQLPCNHTKGCGCPMCGGTMQSDTPSFIQKARKVHGEKYDYSLVVYQKAIIEVMIMCPEHGGFEQKPSVHLTGCGCPVCGTLITRQVTTLENFIMRANAAHGNVYNYENVKFTKLDDKITIGCRVHGDFDQDATSHLQGHGCAACSQRLKMKTHEQFVTESQLVHGDVYDYPDTYIDCHTRLHITCKIHGDFTKLPYDHIQGKSGCNVCGALKRSKDQCTTLQEFIDASTMAHGGKFAYDRVSFDNLDTTVSIGCPEHGYFHQRARNHMMGSGCTRCSNTCKKTRDEFIEQAIAKHGCKYDYSLVDYVGTHVPVDIICHTHGIFKQSPKSHLQHECWDCSRITFGLAIRLTTAEFVSRAREVHGDVYDYTDTVYTIALEKVEVTCKAHGAFSQLPYNHLAGSGCPNCSQSRKFSKVGIDWLSFMATYSNEHVQHALNGGEFKIPGTNYKVDGYCAATNTVYEMNGDFFHGNPKKHQPQDMNPVTHKTYGELYSRTCERKERIMAIGYNFVDVWESQWYCVVKLVVRIQRQFRKRMVDKGRVD